MEFKYKTQAELSKMTPDEVETYTADKRKFEESKFKELAKLTAKEQVDAVKSQLEKAINDKEAFSAESPEFKAMQTMLDNLNKSVEDLGKKKAQNVAGVNKKVGAIFQDKHQLMEKGELETSEIAKERNAKFAIETKAFDSLNVHSVNTIASGTYPANGTVSAVSDTYRSVYAQILGIFNVPRVYSKIMDVVDIQPLVADTIIAFTATITSGFAITAEGAVKPVSKIALTSESETADPVASLFYTTLHMRRFYPSLVNQFVQTFNTLLQEAIPNYVMTEVRSNAVAFTDVAGLEWEAPGKFEAIVAIATSLKKLGYMPNMVSMSPVAYAEMVTEVGSDGHYKLQNGSSIVLIGDTVKIGSHNLQIIEDAFLGDDEILLGDAREAVKVGLDSQVFYFETDGTTDNSNAVGTAPATGLSRNVRTHELAQFVAVLLPAGAKGALVRDTFENVITLTTAA